MKIETMVKVSDTGMRVELRPHMGQISLKDPDTGAFLGEIPQYLGQYRIFCQIPGGEIFCYGYVADPNKVPNAPVNALLRLPDSVDSTIREMVGEMLADDKMRPRFLPPPEPEVEEVEEEDEIWDDDEDVE